MYRIVQPEDAELTALLEEHDDLQVQLSLAVDASSPNPEKINALSFRIVQVEHQIARRQRKPYV